MDLTVHLSEEKLDDMRHGYKLLVLSLNEKGNDIEIERAQHTVLRAISDTKSHDANCLCNVCIVKLFGSIFLGAFTVEQLAEKLRIPVEQATALLHCITQEE